MSKTTLLLLAAMGIGLASATPLTTCTCGQKKHQMESGVIGGENADRNEYPWVVALKYKIGNVFHCGATVINSKWILTAAHCPAGSHHSEFKVVLGEYDLLSGNDGKDFDVAKIVKHTLVDLALMEVRGIIDISTYTPICLPKPGFDIRGEMITLAGWGATCWNNDPLQRPCEHDIMPKILQEVDMPVPPNEVCKQSRTDYFCFGGNGKSGCHGDSGSGIIHNNNGRWTLVGVVSGASPGAVDCGIGPTDFGTGPQLSKFIEWVEENDVGGISCTN